MNSFLSKLSDQFNSIFIFHNKQTATGSYFHTSNFQVIKTTYATCEILELASVDYKHETLLYITEDNLDFSQSMGSHLRLALMQKLVSLFFSCCVKVSQVP